MIVSLRPDLVGIRHPFVWHYLLIDGDNVVALDTGMDLSGWRIRRWFARTGRQPNHLQAILLTHGHLDHAGCAERLRRWSGAHIYLHPADRLIAQGRFPYRGWTRVTGVLESVGRRLSGYQVPMIEQELVDGQELPFWGGLRVIHLPGHTPGHVAIYATAKRVLFLGDAVISPFGGCAFPPRIFNVDGRLLRESIRRIADLDVEWVYPMHHLLLRRNLIEPIRRYARQAERPEPATTRGWKPQSGR